MASIYGNQHRKLQDSFDTRKLADRIEEITVKQEFDEDSKGFTFKFKFIRLIVLFNYQIIFVLKTGICMIMTAAAAAVIFSGA